MAGYEEYQKGKSDEGKKKKSIPKEEKT